LSLKTNSQHSISVQNPHCKEVMATSHHRESDGHHLPTVILISDIFLGIHFFCL